MLLGPGALHVVFGGILGDALEKLRVLLLLSQ